MDLINESEFSLDEITDVTIKNSKLGGKTYWIYMITVLSVMIATLVLIIIMAVNNKRIGDLIAIEGCFLIIVLMLLYFKFLYPKSVKKQYKQNFGDGIKFSYVFHINRVDCHTSSMEYDAKATFHYDKMLKIIEEKDLFKFFIAKGNFLPVKKANFSTNDFNKLEQVLKDVKVKYIKKCK